MGPLERSNQALGGGRLARLRSSLFHCLNQTYSLANFLYPLASVRDIQAAISRHRCNPSA